MTNSLKNGIIRAAIPFALVGIGLSYAIGSGVKITMKKDSNVVVAKFEQTYGSDGVEHDRMLMGWTSPDGAGSAKSDQKVYRKRFAVRKGEMVSAWVTLKRYGRRKVTITQYDTAGNVVESKTSTRYEATSAAYVELLMK